MAVTAIPAAAYASTTQTTTSAVPTSRRGRRPTSRQRSMLSSVTQTIAVRASAVSSSSSGEVRAAVGHGDTANQKTGRAITTATTRPALAATNVAIRNLSSST